MIQPERISRGEEDQRRRFYHGDRKSEMGYTNQRRANTGRLPGGRNKRRA